MNHTIYGLLYLSISISIAAFWFWFFRQCWTKIVLNQKAIVISKPLRSIEIEWKDITEYGRDRVMAYGRNIWRYYFKISGHGDKKFEICREGLKELRTLNAFIIDKSKSAKFNNIEPGMIW